MNDEALKKYLNEVQSRVDTTSKNVPAQSELYKKKYSFSNQSFSNQLLIWDYLWHQTPDEWTRMKAYLFLDAHTKHMNLLTDAWDIIKQWQKRVDNWGDCDALSRIYTKILEIIPGRVLIQLKTWNNSSNIWDRRQSLVSLLYFSRTKKIILPYQTIIAFVDNLIDDPAYYVQKAIGWSLKEMYNVYPEKTLYYLFENTTNISSIAFPAATEKLNKKDKEQLKAIRKYNRTKRR